MITLSGNLTVMRREGVRGSFSVGDLSTPVGEFKVKDTILDQFEPGTYRGTFLVAKIYASSFVWKGRVIAEIRASLADVVIDESNEGSARTRETPPADPDPIDDEKPAAATAAAVKPEAPKRKLKAEATPVEPTTTEEAATTDADVLLFGAELAPAVAALGVVKLDPTVDRESFRKQRDRLKAIGYRFDAKSQSWQVNPSGAAHEPD